MNNQKGVELTNHSRDDFRKVFPEVTNSHQNIDAESVQVAICDESIEEETEEHITDIFKPNFEVYDTAFSHNRHRDQALTFQKLSTANATKNPTLPPMTFNRNQLPLRDARSVSADHKHQMMMSPEPTIEIEKVQTK